jgi:hypothetical protein
MYRYTVYCLLNLITISNAAAPAYLYNFNRILPLMYANTLYVLKS